MDASFPDNSLESSLEKSSLAQSEHLVQEKAEVSVTTPPTQPQEQKENVPGLMGQAAYGVSRFFLLLVDYCEERAILIFLLLLAYGGWFLLCRTGQDISNKLFNSYEHSIVSSNIKDSNFREKYQESLRPYVNDLNSPEPVKERLIAQALEVKIKAVSEFEMTKYFYTQFFVAVSMASIGAVISAVTLFSMSKSGWDNCKSRPLVTIFVVSSGITVFFSSSIFIFQLESNIAENKKLYLGYAALEDRILSYLSTKQFALSTVDAPVNPGQAKTRSFIDKTTEVISYIDGELAAINNIAIGFDAAKIPNYQDLQKLTNEASPGKSSQ
ncbi:MULTISPECIES: hypothetical protein [Trichocoleus]|uniref:Uncharacterized protein n=1 Tax=Trichocoleus desertorum GB2-A4 TaxID=2933944 RepID=A0ABV0JFD5_9CYAN|nr:hypothetical protein [Trichocoleus sp. FACHB-46]MBD1864550.1 hypothetical protein [Trichocoleus sp. FACHB-46]